LFYLYHLPPDVCTASAVAGIGSYFQILELLALRFCDGSVLRARLLDTCVTRGAISGSARQNEWLKLFSAGDKKQGKLDFTVYPLFLSNLPFLPSYSRRRPAT
jgi:hypothetical protein